MKRNIDFEKGVKKMEWDKEENGKSSVGNFQAIREWNLIKMGDMQNGWNRRK